MPAPRVLVAAVVGLLLALTGCSSVTSRLSGRPSAAAGTGTAASAPAPSIQWSDCNDQLRPLVAHQRGSERDLSFSCGRLDVPISYAEPRGATLPLFLVRARLAGQTDRIGSLVVNPGGPGVSGADAALSLALTMPEEVLKRFDLVGFDPRGVAVSTPVRCIPDATKDQIVAAEPRPVTDAQFAEVFGLARTVADECAARYGKALDTFPTVATARDLDRIRQGLGERTLTYLGYSYGTALGATYAQLFPQQVRALVLDAVLDPDADEKADAEAAAAGLEAGFDAFAKNCTGLVAGCPLGADPRGFLENLLAAARQNPIPSARQGEGRKATPGVVLTAVRQALYDSDSWPQLAQGLAAAQRGDAQTLFSLSDSYWRRLQNGTYANLMDAYLATRCADSPNRPSEAEVRALAVDWNKRYPLFGAGAAAELYACSVWRAARTPIPRPTAAGSPPILVVGNTGDPVTPLAGAQHLTKDLASAALVTWQGQGHTAYPKTPCVAAAVNAYLIDLTVPQNGLTCPASG